MDSRRNFDIECLEKKVQKRKRIARTGMLLVVPLLLFLFFALFRGKHYMWMSVFILAGILGPMFLVFEVRKPGAREIVLLATLTAICVSLNEICAHTIPLHAGTTMVVIAGIAAGPEAGFLVGALSRLVCNFFDGQGAWTPWQMAAWGLIGFLAGLVFNKVSQKEIWQEETLAQKMSLSKNNKFSFVMAPIMGILTGWICGYLFWMLFGNGENFFGWYLYVFGTIGMIFGFLCQRKKLSVDVWTTTLYTFFVVFLLYGGIMNFAALLLQYIAAPAENAISIDALKLLYITGVPYDLSHAAGAALCMFFFGDSMLTKLERVQTKYGIKL